MLLMGTKAAVEAGVSAYAMLACLAGQQSVFPCLNKNESISTAATQPSRAGDSKRTCTTWCRCGGKCREVQVALSLYGFVGTPMQLVGATVLFCVDKLFQLHFLLVVVAGRQSFALAEQIVTG